MPFTKAELEERRNYIGASECAAVLGLSRWNTPVGIWAEKTGSIPIEPVESIAAEVGNELEDFIARKFTKQTGKKVHRVTEAFVHKEHPFIRCHIDRKVEGENSILQCKTCSAFKAGEWDGEEIPLDYIFQEVQELACSGYDRAYIAVLIGNHDFKIKVIERDLKLEADMISKLAHFWNTFVIPKVMPGVITARDGDVLYKLYPNAIEGKEISLPDSINALKENLDALKADRKVIQSHIEKVENEIKASIKENEVGNTGIWKIRWKNIHKDAYEAKEQNYRQLFYSKIDKED